MHIHLKNWTLMFKLLYLSSHISYFNKIWSICSIQGLTDWLKFVLPLLKYNFFSRGLFFYWTSCGISSVLVCFCRSACPTVPVISDGSVSPLTLTVVINLGDCCRCWIWSIYLDALVLCHQSQYCRIGLWTNYHHLLQEIWHLSLPFITIGFGTVIDSAFRGGGWWLSW